MRAVGYRKSLPVTDAQALIDIELPKPVAHGHDLLVKVEAVSVNPVDAKFRRRSEPPAGEYQVLGWDVAGVVESVGDAVTSFAPGDRVWYAGAIDRPGANAEFHLVDARIAARMPATLAFPAAASMPLTSITAWELLFDRLGVAADTTGSILIIGAAGGVGSMLIQLAKQLSGLTVIATASREETRRWVSDLGADLVIDHRRPLSEELRNAGVDDVRFVASLTNTADHLAEIARLIAPQGHLGVIDDPAVLDILPFKRKSVAVHWEFMFTRSMFQTPDMVEQHRLLSRVAQMVDSGQLQATIASDYGRINAANLLRAHALLESGKSMGKVVLAGFGDD